MNNWTTVCNESDVLPGTGICALVNGEQVAIFKSSQESTLFAVSNYDPIGKANVLSRGILGSIGDKIVVASPLYKQHFDLSTGECLEDDTASLKTYAVRVDSGKVQLSVA